MLVDVEDSAVGPDIKRPAGRKRLIDVHHAVGLGYRLGRIAEQRVINAE